MSSNLDCVICKNGPLDPSDSDVSVIKTDKGLATLKSAAHQRDILITANKDDLVHVSCRKTFTNTNSLALLAAKHAKNEAPAIPRLRSASTEFDYKKCCLFCGKVCIEDESVHAVQTDTFVEKIREKCESRQDEWGNTVLGRMNYVFNDLHAADSLYHQKCSSNFRTGKDVPKEFAEKPQPKKAGRQPDDQRSSAFYKVVEFLKEDDEEQYSVGDLCSLMKKYMPDDVPPYSTRYMKQKLIELFPEDILITGLNGRENVVTFRQTAAKILYNFHKQHKAEDVEAEKARILDAAARLLKSDIKSKAVTKESYPSTSNISQLQSEDVLSYLPESLKTFLQMLFVGKKSELKVASLGQSIMQATRPRAILAPLHVSLGVQLHHHYSSKFLIRTLNALGYCASYAEVQNFEKSSAVQNPSEVVAELGEDSTELAGSFLQWAADNVDHNPATLDGKNTIHIMGIVSMETPGKFGDVKIARRTDITAKQISTTAKIIPSFYKGGFNATPRFAKLQIGSIINPSWGMDILWKTSLLFQKPRPSWMGTMQTVHMSKLKIQVENPGKTETTLLPMVDMNPSDMSCIYSTLMFIEREAWSHRVVPVVTFDQPLFWKASQIVDNCPDELGRVVLRLGGLHTVMSFLGATGSLMAGSGLDKVLEKVYAENTVTHILSGKAISRAIRGHITTAAALYAILFSTALEVPLPQINSETQDEEDEDSVAAAGDGGDTGDTVDESLPSEDDMDECTAMETDDHDAFPTLLTDTILLAMDDDLAGESPPIQDLPSLLRLQEYFQKLLNHKEDLNSINLNKEVLALHDKLRNVMASLEKESRNARLWLLYLEMIDILLAFIKGERTGNWHLHLQAVGAMVPFFASSGHHHYAKSTLLYLQRMKTLPVTHPELYAKFCTGYHVARRTARAWAGLSTDLIIEQELMRNLKTAGGLTRGRGFTEAQRQQWILSMPACASMNRAMQELTGVSHYTSDQHVEMTEQRQHRDTSDSIKVLAYLQDRNPFEGPIRNISAGTVGGAAVNVEQAKCIGVEMIKKLEDQEIYTCSMKLKNMAVTLAKKSHLKVMGEEVPIDANLLFQRLATIADQQEEDKKAVFSYELSTHPTSLFESPFVPRQANKATLADYLWTLYPIDVSVEEQDVHYVLDGGALLHRIQWPQGQTYESICDMYSDYVKKKYPRVTVVFDGYTSGPTIKDAAHIRRSSVQGEDVILQPHTLCTIKQPHFLANEKNKQAFINMLGKKLEHAGVTVKHAASDADHLIASEALQKSMTCNTIVVADDTDVLILLIYGAANQWIPKSLYFRPEPKKNTPREKRRLWNITLMVKTLGRAVCDHILFAHALLGCDTTSHPFGIAKSVAIKKLKSDPSFREAAGMFQNNNSTQEDISRAIEKCLLIIYNAPANIVSLDELRYQRFVEKTAVSTRAVHSRGLPPTTNAAQYHGWRVYFQTQEWKAGSVAGTSPQAWGWQLNDKLLLPIGMDKPPAPQNLLMVIRCNCKGLCNNQCCSCKKYGLECTFACGHCRGTSCSNSSIPIITDE